MDSPPLLIAEDELSRNVDITPYGFNERLLVAFLFKSSNKRE